MIGDSFNWNERIDRNYYRAVLSGVAASVVITLHCASWLNNDTNLGIAVCPSKLASIFVSMFLEQCELLFYLAR